VSAHERLAALIFDELRGSRPKTAAQIAKAIHQRTRIKTDARSVTAVLMSHPHRFMCRRARFLQRSWRWQLVEAGPAQDPGASGAPVPAYPHRPVLSGSAAAVLTFRDDDPSTNAIAWPV
jgi:hypothetical protein